ncbi:MAG: diaminopimelate epimerase [bacterium]|nr:diaminopimelate epimerase [bacterium]
MTQNSTIPFLKMNGLGNDFIIIDNRALKLSFTNKQVRDLSNRDTGIGCDQLIVLEASEPADIFMRIYNSEGGEVDACGNATRCVGWLLQAELGRLTSLIETNVGLLRAVVQESGDVTVDMGLPRMGWEQIPLSEEFYDTSRIELQLGPIDNPVLHSPCVVNVGNPHCIFWVDDLDAHDLLKVGPFLENHFLFPEQANITLAKVESENEVTIRVWERGAGLTKACGTAACATVVCAVRRGFTDRIITINLPGGALAMEWRQSDDHIMMTGSIELEYAGEFERTDFAL